MLLHQHRVKTGLQCCEQAVLVIGYSHVHNLGYEPGYKRWWVPVKHPFDKCRLSVVRTKAWNIPIIRPVLYVPAFIRANRQASATGQLRLT